MSMRRPIPTTLALCLVTSAAFAEQAVPGDPQRIHPEVRGEIAFLTPGPAIEPLGEGRFRIGRLVLDRNTREIRFSGCMERGRGELDRIVGGSSNPEASALIRSAVEPYDVYLALFLVGVSPAGDRGAVEIAVSWDDGSRRVLLDGPRVEWVFSAARPGGGSAAPADGAVVAWSDPRAVIRSRRPEETARPLLASSELLPPAGTPVELLIRAAPLPALGK